MLPKARFWMASLTHRCPHCDTPYADFSACAALQCSSCLNHFCGLCGEATPEDGHAHVLSCPSRCFYRMDGVFLRLEEWHRGKARKNNLQMDAHLLTLPDSLESVRKRLRATFVQDEGTDTEDESNFSMSPLSEVEDDAPLSPLSDADEDFIRSPAYDPTVHEQLDDLPLSPATEAPALD